MTKVEVSATAEELAKGANVDLTEDTGTGTDGKITKPDVQKVIDARDETDDFDDLDGEAEETAAEPEVEAEAEAEADIEPAPVKAKAKTKKRATKKAS